MKIRPPNMWYMNSTRVIRNQTAYWLMNPSRIRPARKLRCRTMKYGSAATHGRLVHQIHGLPRFDIREMSGWPDQWSTPRLVYSAWYRTGLATNRQYHAADPYGWVAVWFLWYSYAWRL